MKMKLILFILTLMFCLGANAQEITWKQHAVDGHRTGVTQKGAGEMLQGSDQEKVDALVGKLLAKHII